MRGKGFAGSQLCFHVGITPAYAGKSRQIPTHRSHCQDHPRLCGEKVLKRNAYGYRNGSPPPMRGKAGYCVAADQTIGITPAYAGKSELENNYDERAEDHPRLCGEKTKKIPKQRYFFHQLASFSFSLQYT